MSHLLHADYEALAQHADRFLALAEQGRQQLAPVRGSVSDLESGGWRGDAATTFYSKMSDTTFPASEQVLQHLESASATFRHIISILEQQEQEAGAAFRLS